MGLALGLVRDAEIRLPGIAGLEGGENLLEQGLVLLGAPDGQAHSLPLRIAALRRRRVLAGGEEQQRPQRQEQKHTLFHSVRPFRLISAAPPQAVGRFGAMVRPTDTVRIL